MSKGIVSSTMEMLKEDNSELPADEYTIVNVRPSKKIGAMLDLMTALSGKNYSSVMSEIISLKLAALVGSNIEYADCILDAAEQVLNDEKSFFQKSSALNLLEEEGYIKYYLYDIKW